MLQRSARRSRMPYFTTTTVGFLYPGLTGHGKSAFTQKGLPCKTAHSSPFLLLSVYLLLESRKWALEPGKDYFVCRNGSSIIAFRMGDQLENYSFNVAAAHTDSPCFRIKENAEIHMGQNYTKLNTEGYGGMICATWMDRQIGRAHV